VKIRESSRKIRTDRVAQGFILFNFVLYLFKLFQTGEINKFVAPRISWLLMITLGILLVLMVYAFLTSLRADEHQDCTCCAHTHNRNGKAVWILLLLPPVIGVCFPLQSLNTSMLNSQLHAASSIKKAPVKKETSTNIVVAKSADGRSSDKRELSLADLQENYSYSPRQYENQAFTVTGMVYHPPGWKAKRFIVMRYMISCCAADATPVGLVVEMEKGKKYKDNTWVKVGGVMAAEKMPEMDTLLPVSWWNDVEKKPILLGQSIQEIAEPAQPYLSVPLINLTEGEQ
jgi:putative membrane protein